MSYTELFLNAFAFMIRNEGTYSNDPNDQGGETWRGISRKNWPDWEGWKLIDQMKGPQGKLNVQEALNHKGLEGMVRFFYHLNFWIPLRGDELGGTMPIALFDMAVNQGLGQAVKNLQAALNLLNNREKYYPNMFVDGKFGPTTLENFKKYMATARLNGRSVEDCERVLTKVMKALQAARYIELCRQQEDMEQYFYGWMKMRI
jgi:lysozyme family protein